MEEASQNNATGEQKKKSGSNMILAIIAILILLGLGVAVLSGKKGTTPESSTSASRPESSAMSDSMTTASTAPESSASPAASAGTTASGSPDVKAAESDEVTINLEAGSFYYKPDVIKVKKGQKVKIILKAVDMMHDFNIDELDVDIPVTKSGETNTVEFTPEKTGTFEYYCSVGEHRAKGQVGKITVE